MEVSQAARGRPLPRRSLRSRRSLESYLAASILPRYMQRLREIQDELIIHTAHLERAYRELAGVCGEEPDVFERRWRRVAAEWNFDYVNGLIGEHNEYYPIEANLPLDPKTGDFVPLAGRPYRREHAGPRWVLERFPPVPPGPARRARPARRT
jgi:hypothetical protein